MHRLRVSRGGARPLAYAGLLGLGLATAPEAKAQSQGQQGRKEGQVSKAEKICPGESRGYRRHLKRKVKRARRRSEKHDVENATTRLKDHTRGWST